MRTSRADRIGRWLRLQAGFGGPLDGADIAETGALQAIIPSSLKAGLGHGPQQPKDAADADPRPDLDRAGPPRRARRAVAFRPRQAIRARPDHVQQIQAHHPDGRERWPSTESVAKALAATDTAIDTFVQLIGDRARAGAVRAAARLRAGRRRRLFRRRRLSGRQGLGRGRAAAVNDEHAYALEISGDSMKPAYRDGDVIVVSPGTPIRRGDRVVVKTSDGEVMVKELKRRTCKDARAGARSIRAIQTARSRRRRRVDRADRLGEPIVTSHADCSVRSIHPSSPHSAVRSPFECISCQTAG